MSGPIRSISQNSVSKLCTPNIPSPGPFSRNGSPEQVRIIDTVRISDAAMRKFRQSEEARSGSVALEKNLNNIKDKDLEESLKVLEIDSADIGREGIKKAFLQSIKKYHPDTYYASNPETLGFAEERTRKIIEAYRNIKQKT